MKKLAILLSFLIFVSGCLHFLTPEDIIKNPDRVAKECNKVEGEDRTNCFNTFAKEVSIISHDTSITICNNLDKGYDQNKCLFNVFSNLEGKDMLEEGIEVCEHIEKRRILRIL